MLLLLTGLIGKRLKTNNNGQRHAMIFCTSDNPVGFYNDGKHRDANDRTLNGIPFALMDVCLKSGVFPLLTEVLISHSSQKLFNNWGSFPFRSNFNLFPIFQTIVYPFCKVQSKFINEKILFILLGICFENNRFILILT